MEIQINQIIGLNKLQYINKVDGEFNNWCEHLSNSFYVPMRELQKNVKLYNWFLKQWDMRVVEVFLVQNQDFIKAGVVDPQTYYILFQDVLKSPYNMKSVYPNVLIKAIKKEHYKTLHKNDR